MAEARARVTFVVDGALEQNTGGYLYDRIVVDGLRRAGTVVRVVSLAAEGRGARFVAIGQATRALFAGDHEDAIVIDELCHPRVVASVIAARALRWRRPRVVVLVHHLAASERTGFSRFGRLAVERALLAAADRVVATSFTTARVLERLGVRSVRVARPGRDRLGQRDEPTDADPSLGTRFLFLGAMTPRKDPLAAIAAFAHVADRAHLTLVGPVNRDLACAAEVRRAIGTLGSRVRLRGELDDAGVARELASHDVLLAPSRYEGFGIAAAEALAHGLLVIATRAGALTEVVGEGEGAILTPLDDSHALAAAVARAADDSRWLTRQKEQALLRARRLPTWEQTIHDFASAVLDD